MIFKITAVSLQAQNHTLFEMLVPIVAKLAVRYLKQHIRGKKFNKFNFQRDVITVSGVPQALFRKLCLKITNWLVKNLILKTFATKSFEKYYIFSYYTLSIQEGFTCIKENLKHEFFSSFPRFFLMCIILVQFLIKLKNLATTNFSQTILTYMVKSC